MHGDTRLRAEAWTGVRNNLLLVPQFTSRWKCSLCSHGSCKCVVLRCFTVCSATFHNVIIIHQRSEVSNLNYYRGYYFLFAVVNVWWLTLHAILRLYLLRKQNDVFTYHRNNSHKKMMKFDTTREFFLFVQNCYLVQHIFNLRSRYFLTHKGSVSLRCVYVSLKVCHAQNLK